ncbi:MULTISPECIES: hypothetical protein [unclassified Pseudomonas]|uniref:hypothetical protein n=1 Tax=unclassified Pseudomonas TaxID=196821 RepID=UPI000538A053|nr:MULTISPECIES: hypothetical protein [unclassified Pseudomonas]MBD0683289.1 hypothetical protein [Pseudomonas sp. PSB18]CDF94190.1 hypothetical protein BN844_1625 [Pseudomonas sp. SHC52]
MPMFSSQERQSALMHCQQQIAAVAAASTKTEVIEKTKYAHGYLAAMAKIEAIDWAAYGQLAAGLNELHHEKLGLPPPGKD